jgi:hypothetical protein
MVLRLFLDETVPALREIGGHWNYLDSMIGTKAWEFADRGLDESSARVTDPALGQIAREGR